MIKENQKALNGLWLLGDWGCIFLALWVSCMVRFTFFPLHPNYLRFSSYLWLLLFILPAHALLGSLLGLYRSKRSSRLLREIRILLQIDLISMISLLTLLYLLHLEYYSRLALFFFALLVPLLLSAERIVLRLLLRAMRKKGYNLKYILLIGNNTLAESFVEKVRKNPNFGFRFVGCLSAKPTGKFFYGVPILGNYDALAQILEAGGVDEVMVALELTEYVKLQKIIYLCEKYGVKIHVIPAYFQYIPSHPYWDEFDGLPVMSLRKIPLTNPLNALLKRVFDIGVSLAAITLTSPVLLGVWLVLRLGMRESPIFRQERIGMGCKPFIMFKFRSMATDAGSESGWTEKKDTRRTPFGAFIRKFSIDELPQFFNVLHGEMSVVGPRPEIQCYVDQFRESIPRYMVKHQVKPGITGWAQIQGLRGDTSIEERIQQDIYYIENWSLWLDIRIVFRTITKAFYNHNE